MTVEFAGAVRAYDKALRQGNGVGLESRDGAPRPDFAEMLKGATESAIGTLREGEVQTLKAAAGVADLTEVVMAVSKAEMTLQTAVTIRDKVVTAYQEILRMPI